LTLIAQGGRTADMTETEALAAIRAREPIFHRPELASTRADFERMTDPSFWEVGASGRVYDRGYVLDELERRYASPHEDLWEVTELACRDLGNSVFLATYLLIQGRRVTRRATLWRYDGQWWAVYHQGTIVSEGA
jgi:hypothetical protein